MYIKKYTLTIPFKLNNNSSVSIKNDEETTFKLNEYSINIHLDNNKGFFKIYHFYDKFSIINFYNDFKKIIPLLNLDYSLWSIKIEEISEANICKYVTIDYEIDKSKIKENQLIFKPEVMIETSNFKMSIIQQKDLEKIISEIQFYYSKKSSLNFDNDRKLKTSLDLYSDSYFRDKEARFLTYITILELLKPKINRENEGKQCCEDLKNIVKKYKNKYPNEKLQEEFEEINGSLSHICERSISYSIKKLSDEYSITLDEKDIEELIHISYKVRSKFVHNGVIRTEFETCLAFLDEYIPKLLKLIIEEKLQIN